MNSEVMVTGEDLVSFQGAQLLTLDIVLVLMAFAALEGNTSLLSNHQGMTQDIAYTL